jgi:branched-chain amino acid aminotransferase
LRLQHAHAGGEEGDQAKPTVICEVVQIPFASRVEKYRHGLEMVTVSTRRIPPQCVPPRIKLHSYVNNMLADAEAHASNPNAYALMQDIHGHIAEGTSYNFFLVKDGVLLTPRELYTLSGVSRAGIISLAAKLGIPCEERDLVQRQRLCCPHFTL